MTKLNPINGGGKKSPNRLQKQRNGLLALVHIAKKDLGLSDMEYREILMQWSAGSAAALSIKELEDLVRYFESIGFKRKKSKKQRAQDQAAALRARIEGEAEELDNSQDRLKGLVKKIAAVDDLKFCHDVTKLKIILSVISDIKRQELNADPHRTFH